MPCMSFASSFLLKLVELLQLLELVFDRQEQLLVEVEVAPRAGPILLHLRE